MTMQATGPISISQVAVELSTTPGGLTLGNTRVRNLANDLSGPVRMSDLYGKSSNNRILIPGYNAGTDTYGYDSGLRSGQPVIGSLSDTNFNGFIIDSVLDAGAGTPFDTLTISLFGPNTSPTTFTSFTLDGQVFYSKNANFVGQPYYADRGYWSFAYQTFVFIVGKPYSFTIQ